jgi:indole-3-glycerol phosphate synthase
VSSILQKIVAHKLDEITAAKIACPLAEVREAAQSATPAKDFLAALKATDHVSLIAEVKKASTSNGIIRNDFDPVEIATAYQENGAACVSVLTDEHFFRGHLDFLRSIRAAIKIPLLRKDFILDEYQIFEARAAGADAVLLIAECLEARQMIDLHQLVVQLGMTPLVELYDEKNLDAVLACQPKLVGINNRDLNTFTVDLNHSMRIKQRLPTDVISVSESGIFTPADVAQLRIAGVDAMLVGESLMRAADIGAAVRKLLSR